VKSLITYDSFELLTLQLCNWESQWESVHQP
jgi:hypothetical protein